MSQLVAIAEKEPAHQACEAALRRAVLVGELPVGSKLPTERELAATFGVSRLTLRAALATLTAQGVLSVRHGSGYFVQDIGRTGGPDWLPQLTAMAEARGDLPGIAADLLRVRRSLARGVLEHLAEHPPKAADVRAFTEALDAFAATVEQTPADLVAIAEADLQVVGALVDATHSPVLRLCLNPVILVVGVSPSLCAAMFRAPRSNVEGWRALAAWLAAPTAGAIEKVMTLLAERDRATVDVLRRKARAAARDARDRS
jgi:DNA-binding FadR family transcriptional regulator